MARTRVLLVDDHNIIITGIRSMLEGEASIEVVGEARSGQEVLDKFGQGLEADLVLMDIKMPEKNGIETTRELLTQRPDLKVMALTMYDDEEYISTMLQAGAKGYVLKNTGKQELLLGIEKIMGGGTYFSSEATTAMMNRYMGGGSSANGAGDSQAARIASHEVPLTRREKEILKLIASELTNQEIADKLFISPRTVHSHRRNLMQKVGVKNTAGLVRYAIKHEII